MVRLNLSPVTPDEAMHFAGKMTLSEVREIKPFALAFLEKYGSVLGDSTEFAITQGRSSFWWLLDTIYYAGYTAGIRAERKKRAARNGNSEAAQRT